MIDSSPDYRPEVNIPGTGLDAGPLAVRTFLQHAESILDHAPLPLTIVRANGYRFLYANTAFRHRYVMPRDNQELSISDVFDGRVGAKLRALVDKCASLPGGSHSTIVHMTSGDAGLSCSAWPLGDEGLPGQAAVLIEMRPMTDENAERAMQVDLSQRLVLSALRDQALAEAALAAEAAAEMANRSKARFLSTMSHELRTPLNAIGGYAELIDMGLRGPVTPAQRSDLARIQRAQVHLLGLINSVLNFTKLESGTVRFEMTAVRITPVMETVRDMLMPHLERQGLTYRAVDRCPPSDEPLLVSADPEKLRQVLINLLTNAIKFTTRGGAITVGCDTRPGLVLVHIEDTGRGIPQDQLSSIFDPFVQVGRRLSSADEGVGLGLSISRDLARGMGGDLGVTSELGVGSTFTLTLKQPNTGERPSP
jgi:signal transduction histidine kinase